MINCVIQDSYPQTLSVMQKFVSYTRVSTQKQGFTGLGMQAQQSAIDSFVKNNHCSVIAEFVEVESGKRNDRPELKKAIDWCLATNSILLIAKLDRLARNAHFILSLMESGVEFKALDLPEANKMTITIMAAMAEHERLMISERTKAALAQKKAQGVILGNPRLDEYRNTDTTNANAARTIKANDRANRIMLGINMAKSLGYNTLQSIADYLNNNGFTTARGSKFNPTTVKRTIQRLEALSA